ncbi:hypothetical protein [Amnibacterium kyonggiense]|nr:hypothetical protein [Amnibacterium kyonggiense]
MVFDPQADRRLCRTGALDARSDDGARDAVDAVIEPGVLRGHGG